MKLRPRESVKICHDNHGKRFSSERLSPNCVRSETAWWLSRRTFGIHASVILDFSNAEFENELQSVPLKISTFEQWLKFSASIRQRFPMALPKAETFVSTV